MAEEFLWNDFPQEGKSIAINGKFVLHIRVQEGKDVPIGDTTTSDCYCVVSMANASANDGNRHRTETIDKTLEPVWKASDTTFDLSKSDDAIVVQLFDRDLVGRDDFLGQVVIPLNDVLQRGGSVSGWFKLVDTESKPTRGSLFIAVIADPGVKDSKQGKEALIYRRTNMFQKLLFPKGSFEIMELKERPHFNLYVGTWNVGNAEPPDDLKHWIQLGGCDVFAIGAQECEYKARKPHFTADADWQSVLKTFFGPEYELVQHHDLMEMRLSIFCKSSIRPYITMIGKSTEATGFASVVGNKGGVSVSLKVKDTPIVFVNTHLAAHWDQKDKRKANFEEIIRGLKLGANNIDILSQFHHVFWFGDLNYRLDYPGVTENTPTKEQFDAVVEIIGEGEPKRWLQLFSNDQLASERKQENCFVGFHEGQYEFPPTFKVKRNEVNNYNRERLPAWCDRILWRSFDPYYGTVKQLLLGSTTLMMTSDHKPVFSQFTVEYMTLPVGVDPELGPCQIQISNLKICNLPADDIATNSSDPYVCFRSPYLQRTDYKTSIKKNNLCPIWADNEVPNLDLTINAVNRLYYTFINVLVFDKDASSKDDLLAQAPLHLGPIIAKDRDKPFELELPLERGGLYKQVDPADKQLKPTKLTCTVQLKWGK